MGNPGVEYANTRHNIGFKVLDAWAQASNFSFESDRYGMRAETKWKGRPFVLIKPATYMNLSGKAVNYWLQQEKVDVANLLVVTDDIALPFGKIRIKGKGSDGGHNGLKSIIQTLGHPNFPRLRFGVGDEFSKGKQVDYVLGEWSSTEEKALDERIDLSIEAIKTFGVMGLNAAMNGYNNK